MTEIDLFQKNIYDSLKMLSVPGLEGYRPEKLLYAELYALYGKSGSSLTKKTIKHIIFNAYKVSFKTAAKKSGLMLVSFDYGRKDHTKAWNDFKSLCDDYDEITIENKKEFTGLKAFSSISRYGKIKRSLKGIDGKYRKVLAALLTELLRLDEKLNSYSLDDKASIMFFDGGYYENLITQKFRKMGMKTVTQQHGQPVYHGNCDYINQAMILNFTSDYIIVPGEFGKKQFVAGGIDGECVKNLGSLREIVAFHEEKSLRFCVFLDCPTNPGALENNLLLIKYGEQLAEELGMEFTIKIHPQDNKARYENETKRGKVAEGNANLSDILADKEFAILHASGVYLDILANGKKAFCMEDENFKIVEKRTELFDSYDGLLTAIRQWNEFGEEEKKAYLDDIVKNYLNPEGAAERYKEFIGNLLV